MPRGPHRGLCGAVKIYKRRCWRGLKEAVEYGTRKGLSPDKALKSLSGETSIEQQRPGGRGRMHES